MVECFPPPIMAIGASPVSPVPLGACFYLGRQGRCLVGRFSNAELRKFRDTSRCSACVHYCGCQLWLALLLMNDELTAPGLDIILPDITKACPMFFPWSSESSRSATTNPGGRSPRRN